MCETCDIVHIIEDTRDNKIFIHYIHDASGNLVPIFREATAFLNGCIQFKNGILAKQGLDPYIHLEYEWIE